MKEVWKYPTNKINDKRKNGKDQGFFLEILLGGIMFLGNIFSFRLPSCPFVGGWHNFSVLRTFVFVGVLQIGIFHLLRRGIMRLVSHFKE